MSAPNFLVIMTDQHRADHLGCYGNATVRTPTIDALAQNGFLFERCYVASPSCMPNRASFMTGRMPSLHGVRHNGIPLSRGQPTFVEVLRAAGYATALIGKSHLQNMEDHEPVLVPRHDDARRSVFGFGEAHRDDLTDVFYRQESPAAWRFADHHIEAPFYGFEHVELADEHGDLVFGDYTRWLASRAPEVNEARGPAGALPANVVAPQAWRTSVPAPLYPSSYIGDRAESWLAARAKAGDRRPFFLFCSFPDPHHPFTPPGRYWDLYRPDEVKLPNAFAHPLAKMPRRLAWLHTERANDKAPLNAHRAFAVTADEARQAIALTYGMIGLVDDTVARVLGALRDSGADRDTVVIFTSDHGDFMGDHGLLLKGPLHYQGLIRVPLIWHDPAAPAGGRIDSLCSTIDIADTVLARAGLAAPYGMQGRSLLPLVRGDAASVRDAILIEDETQRRMFGEAQPLRLRTLVTETARLSIASDGSGELYDLAGDPEEFTDLWDNPTAAPQRHNLTERLAHILMNSADYSPAPTGRA